MHASATDYASLLRSEEAASLEAALSFLSDCDDSAADTVAGHSSEAAAWRLLQDASSHDLDVDIVESHDDDDGDDGSDNHALHLHFPHFGAFKRPAVMPKEEQRDDAADDEMLSALLAAEHLPTMNSTSPDSSANTNSHASPWSAAHASGFVSHNAGVFAHDSGEYKPQHNPGLMMAMMSAGFPDLTYNPQSLLLAPAQHHDDGSSSPHSSGGGSPTASAAVTPTATSSTAQAPTSTAVTKKRASKKKPAGYNSNRARDERKEELIYLRKTVLEMEARLSKLKQSAPPALPASTTASESAVRAGASAPGVSPSSDSLAAPVSTAVSSASSSSPRVTPTARPTTQQQQQQQLSQSVWEDIATRQYKERRRAELENIRLKLILEGQIKMAKALEKILKKRTSLRILESVRGGGKRVKCVHRPGSDDAAIFAELLAGVEKTLDEVDGVFEANGLGRMQTAYRDAQLRHDDASGMVMEIFANKVMPFDVHATASAVWRHYAHSMEHMPSRSHYQKQPPHIETTDDTLVESYGLELHGSRTKGNFICKQVMRKFEQRERIVIGWRAQAEAVDLSAEPTAGIRLVERGYTVIKALAHMATPHTLVQTCYIIRPHVYDEIADKERKVGALTDFILNCIAGTISASHQMIENFLLDQALQRK